MLTSIWPSVCHKQPEILDLHMKAESLMENDNGWFIYPGAYQRKEGLLDQVLESFVSRLPEAKELLEPHHPDAVPHMPRGYYWMACAPLYHRHSPPNQRHNGASATELMIWNRRRHSLPIPMRSSGSDLCIRSVLEVAKRAFVDGNKRHPNSDWEFCKEDAFPDSMCMTWSLIEDPSIPTDTLVIGYGGLDNELTDVEWDFLDYKRTLASAHVVKCVRTTGRECAMERKYKEAAA